MAEATANNVKVTLYWLEASRAQRLAWLLDECKGIDWHLETFKRGEDKLAPAALKKIHPLGKSPIVKIEAPTASEPLILAESGFIIEYLAERFAPHLVPTRYQDGKDGQMGGENEEWLRYRYYMHYAEGSLITILLIAMIINNIRDAPVPFFIKPITRGIAGKIDSSFLDQQFKTHFEFLESQLNTAPQGGPYLCGKDITAADIQMSYPLIAGKSKVDSKLYPAIATYTKLLESNDVYQRSIKKVEELTGEPFKVVP